MNTGIIIDDDIDLVDSIKDLLEMNDFKILGTASDGHTGFELFKKTMPNFVILDMKMPNFDGYYGAEKIKQFDSNAKIIMLTGNSNTENEINVNKVMIKPCNPRNLINTINDLIETSQKMIVN